jgi:hypothetical protein
MMAASMEGIMGIPQAAAPQINVDPVLQSYANNSPVEMNRGLVDSLSQADPQLVAMLRQELQALNLTERDIADLRAMVQRILKNPENYAQVRAELIATAGLEEDDLPPTYDGPFFQAMAMVLEQITPSQEPMTMAQGGLASLGRFGDTQLAHVTPQEAALLKSLGGSGSINPRTGLREFGWLSRAWKKIKNTAKKIVSSPIGRIVATVGLSMVLGPAVSGFLGSGVSAAVTNAVTAGLANTAVNLVSGQSFGDALKGGVISGALAYGGTKLFSPEKMATPAPVDDKSIFQAPTAQTSTGAIEGSGAAAPVPLAPSTMQAGPITPPTGAIVDENLGFLTGQEAVDLGNSYQPAAFNAPVAAAPGAVQQAQAPGAGQQAAPVKPITQTPAAPKVTPPEPGLFDRVKQFGSDLIESPLDTLGETYDKYLSPDRYKGPEFDAKVQEFMAKNKATYTEAVDALKPGMISRYAPLAAAGTGIMALSGGFEEGEPPPLPDWVDEYNTSGRELLDQNPEKYGLNYGGTRFMNRGFYNPYRNKYPRYAAEGGIMDAYPRMNGHISGPGTGTSDDVPAMLSDGEFVMTANAVRGMGNGSRRAGAKKMYALMKGLEQRNA